ncbi:MAG: insulinase family protein [Prolixibacteraceae bacterium]|nr:insulinase family protein [Prolixibacteraceae bacterium]
MIQFEKRILDNGLRVIVHVDETTPMVAVNVAYDVGSRDEDPEKTGFAHLFEHLMFGGSKHIPNYDTPLQKVGGDNNAYTTNDLTNYYLTVPAANIETGFWLESDRMLELAFSKKSLDVQRNVVIEEFKQRYLNQPYGDVYPLARDLAYTLHPYRWPTIGKEISHIENATLADVKAFFYRHYAPNNAVLTVTGPVNPDEVFRLAENWFGPIPRRDVPLRNLPVEPVQTAFRSKVVERDVPFDALYISFHMDEKLGPDFVTTDLISDVLSNGQSSRLYRKLVIEQRLFGELDAYISGDVDPGLFTIAGKLIEGVSMELAEAAVWNELYAMQQSLVEERELQKVINKVEANLVYSEINYLNKAMALAAFELLGDANLINRQNEWYRAVTPARLQEVAVRLFTRENCSTLYYFKKKENDQSK